MDRRSITALYAAAALGGLAVACGPHGGNGDPAVAFRAGDTASARTARTARDAAALRTARRAAARRRAADTLQASLAVAADARAALVTLALVNTAGRRLELNFPDGRTRDFAVYDAAGREVWRWSRGRLFTQVMQNKPIAAHDTARWAAAWDAPAPGQYTVVAELRSENHPTRQVATFVVPATGAGAVAQARAGAAAPAPPAADR